MVQVPHAKSKQNYFTACPQNFYRDESSLECIPCPDNRTTQDIGSTSATDCQWLRGQ